MAMIIFIFIFILLFLFVFRYLIYGQGRVVEGEKSSFKTENRFCLEYLGEDQRATWFRRTTVRCENANTKLVWEMRKGVNSIALRPRRTESNAISFANLSADADDDEDTKAKSRENAKSIR